VSFLRLLPLGLVTLRIRRLSYLGNPQDLIITLNEIEQRLPDLPFDRWDPIIQHRVFKANIYATQRYMGLRCEWGKQEWVQGGLSLASILLPALNHDETEDIWRLIILATVVADAETREGAEAALRTFSQEASALVTALQLKGRLYATVYGIPVVEAYDLSVDLLGVAESSGCSWAP
jgi:hypothetical protein